MKKSVRTFVITSTSTLSLSEEVNSSTKTLESGRRTWTRQLNLFLVFYVTKNTDLTPLSTVDEHGQSFHLEFPRVDQLRYVAGEPLFPLYNKYNFRKLH